MQVQKSMQVYYKQPRGKHIDALSKKKLHSYMFNKTPYQIDVT